MNVRDVGNVDEATAENPSDYRMFTCLLKFGILELA